MLLQDGGLPMIRWWLQRAAAAYFGHVSNAVPPPKTVEDALDIRRIFTAYGLQTDGAVPG